MPIRALACVGASGTASEEVEVLLVEDSQADGELMLHALRRKNFGQPVHWVKDGDEALDFVFRTGAYAQHRAARAPKLILLDIKMPKVNGIEVLRRVKQSEATRSIPVVVMTSSNEERDVAESYRLGANGYVVKPVDFEAFLEAVAKTCLYWLLTNRVPH